MTTNMNDFIRTNGELAQAVFDEIRAISASPAPGRGVTRLAIPETTRPMTDRRKADEQAMEQTVCVRPRLHGVGRAATVK